jgi:uncharacterized protein (TIGR00369 family)
VTTHQEIDALAAPEGFQKLPPRGGFLEHNGPLYTRRDGDGVVFGFRVQERHCNPLGVCHGGWLASIVDTALPIGARATDERLSRYYLLTIQISIDFLAGAQRDDWVECHVQLLSQTGRLAFVQGVMSVQGKPICRGSGIFRIGPEGPPLTF